MKWWILVGTLASLLGCSGSVETANNTGSNSGGGGAGTTSSNTGTAGQGGSTGVGGTGGGIDIGGTGGAGGATSQMSCPIVLDKGFYVDFTVDGLPLSFTNGCNGDDGMGPMARMFHGKGSGPDFEIFACKSPGQLTPRLDMFVDAPEVPDNVTTIPYTDAAGNLATTNTGISNFTTYGPEWTNVTGTFHGKVAGSDGAVQTVDGSFFLCRRPDLYAP